MKHLTNRIGRSTRTPWASTIIKIVVSDIFARLARRSLMIAKSVIAQASQALVLFSFLGKNSEKPLLLALVTFLD